jgi:hypothetical protein
MWRRGIRNASAYLLSANERIDALAELCFALQTALRGSGACGAGARWMRA